MTPPDEEWEAMDAATHDQQMMDWMEDWTMEQEGWGQE